MMDFNLITILVISFGSWAVFAWKIRRIQFISLDTDNEKQVYSASQSHRWRWLSDMHKISIGKTSMKDVMIILLSVFQKILRDKKGDRPLILLTSFAHVTSAVLIYLTASNYWSESASLLVAILYLVSMWPWEIALYGGHLNIATMMFMLTVYLGQQIDPNLPPQIWLAVAGFFMCLTLFSSASSIKYIPLFVGLIFYERYSHFLNNSLWPDLYYNLLKNYSILFNVILPLITLISFLIILLIYKKIVTDMYYNKSYPFLNKKVEGRDKYNLGHYLVHAKKKVKFIGLWMARTNVFFIILVNFLGLDYLVPIFTGLVIAFLILTLPNVKKAFINYMRYVMSIEAQSHFKIYIDFFAKRGIKVDRHFRGAGWEWIVKYFWRIIPAHIIIYAGLLVITLTAINGQNIIDLSLIILLSLSPILWGEYTKGVQIGRTYAPCLVGILIFIAYAFSLIQTTYSPTVYWTIFYLTLAGVTAWNLRILATDIFPARMAIPNLINILTKEGIKEFYTYKTNYNNGLVNAIDLNPKVAGKFKINYVNLISEIKDPNAWLVIPGTSNKAFLMESEKEGIANGDFDDKDPILFQLIKTRIIEKIATAKIKTSGTSRIWIHGSEVSSFRDLILGDVKEVDLFKGYAWLVNVNKIKELGII